MKQGVASGFEAAVAIFAVTLLAVPISRFLLSGLEASTEEAEMVGRGLPFLIGALLMLAFAGLRQAAVRDLSKPIPRHARVDVAFAMVLGVALPFATVFIHSLWIWETDGALGLERRMAVSPEIEWHSAFAGLNPIWWLLFAAFTAPIMEELAFRGFLYRAFGRQAGWGSATFLTSMLFGLYHPQFVNSFLFSVLLICVLRRTGTLWACIAVHATGNLMLWYPLTGQFLLPRQGEITNPLTWKLHLSCLLFVSIAFPVYLWLAAREPAWQRNEGGFHAPLPQ